MDSFIQSHWFPDLIILLVILAFAFIKCRKGLFKCIIPVIILVASIVGAFVLTPIVEPIVSKSLQPWVENNITSKLEDLNLEDLEILLKSNEMKELIGKKDKASEEETVTITEKLKEVLPENVSNLLEEYGVNAKDIFKNVKLPDLNFNASNVKDQALSIIEGIIVSSAAKIVHAAVFMVIALALLIVLNIIKLFLNPLFDKLPVVGTLNRLGGLLFGIIEAVLIIWLVVGVIKTFNILDIAEIAKGTYLLNFFLNVSFKTLLSIV